MTPKQTQILKNAQIILQSYRPMEEHLSLCVAEVKAHISELLQREEARDNSKANDAVVDLLYSVRAELARHFADAEAPRATSKKVLH